MIYRVRADIAFAIEDEARDFYHDCQLALPKGVTINPDQDNAEPSLIQLEECRHDLTPALPCVILEAQSSTTPP